MALGIGMGLGFGNGAHAPQFTAGYAVVPSSGLPPGCAFTRSTSETVRTGTATLTSIGPNVCGIGRENDAWELGYSIEGTSGGNALVTTLSAAAVRDPTLGSSYSGTTTWTPSGLVGPDGTGNVKRCQQASGGNIWQLVNQANTGTKLPAISMWVRSVSGGTAYQGSLYGGTVTVDNVTSLSTSWVHRTFTQGTANVTFAWLLCRADDLSAFGGLGAGARDVCFDYVQIDLDGVVRETSLNAVRPAGVFTVYGVPSFGRQYGYCRFRSKCDSALLPATGSLWDANDGINYLRISTTTVTLGYGATQSVTTASYPPFTRGQMVEFSWEYGGIGGTLIRARVGYTGAWTTIYAGSAITNTCPSVVQTFKNLDVWAYPFMFFNESTSATYNQLNGLTRVTTKRSTGSTPWGSDFSSAETVVTTSGTEIITDFHSNQTGQFGDFAYAVDGMQTSYINATSDLAISNSVSGSHTYRWRDGGNSAYWSGSAWVVNVAAIKSVRIAGDLSATASVYTPPMKRVVVLGDSIADGAVATHITTQGAFQLIRDAGAYGVSLCTAGNLSLWDLTQTSLQVTANCIAAALDGTSKNIIYIELGFNDFNRGQWNATAFGTAYVGLLDVLHATCPNAKIVAQSPIPSLIVIANGLGSYLADYRTQIQTAAAARSSFVTFSDGSVMTVGLSGDGIHPTTAGQAQWEAYILTTLGTL